MIEYWWKCYTSLKYTKNQFREVKCIDLSLFQVLQKVTMFRFGVTRQIESEPKIYPYCFPIHLRYSPLVTPCTHSG